MRHVTAAQRQTSAAIYVVSFPARFVPHVCYVLVLQFVVWPVVQSETGGLRIKSWGELHGEGLSASAGDNY